MKNIAIFFRIFNKWSNCHQSLYVYMGEFGNNGNCLQNFAGPEPILAFLFPDIDLQKDVDINVFFGRLFFNLFSQSHCINGVDQDCFIDDLAYLVLLQMSDHMPADVIRKCGRLFKNLLNLIFTEVTDAGIICLPEKFHRFCFTDSYQRYILRDWNYFLISNGSCNNIALNLALSRNSTDNPIYPRRGSEFTLSVGLTPPYSLFDNKDYKNLANNYQSASYQREMQEKYKWIEYHKWKFKLRTYTALSSMVKCPVLMTRIEFGLLGAYNKYKKSPFETYYVGGDGMSGYSTTYATETIGLRGYDNGSLTPSGYTGYAYDRFTLELRYPLMLQGSTNIYALTFIEGGNAWSSVKDFNPFDMKRSAGVGVRIFLPMVGLLGIDWAYGFDDVFGSKQYGGSQFHFILGQEF